MQRPADLFRPLESGLRQQPARAEYRVCCAYDCARGLQRSPHSGQLGPN
jgi:hypothetical protein